MGRAHVVSMMSECVRVPFSEVALSASFVITKDFLPVIEQLCSSYSDFFFLYYPLPHYPPIMPCHRYFFSFDELQRKDTSHDDGTIR